LCFAAAALVSVCSINPVAGHAANAVEAGDAAGTVLAQTSFEGAFEPFGVYNEPLEIRKSLISIETDLTAPDGASVAQISLEPGVKDGNYVGCIYYDFSGEAQPKEMWGQFYVKFSENYVWHSIANKIVYMRMGDQNPEDGTTEPDHVLGINHQWIDAPNIGWATQHATNSELNQMFHFETDEFIREKWHKIAFHVMMNTPGQCDGIGRIWLNDALIVNAADIMWLNEGNPGGVADFRITPLWGGLGPEVVKMTQYIYFDSVILQTAPFPGLE
jgi:hypothetical protein